MTIPSPARPDWFEDQAIGHNGLSPTRTVTGADIGLFAGLTGDMAELHTSDSHAATTEFGGRIAHGMLNLALMHGLIVRSGRLVSSGLALLGWSEIRFTAPVRIGDTVQAEWETVSLRDSASRPEAGIVTDRVTLRNQHGKTVVTGLVTELVRKRPV
ncbi:MaoC family dehydratase [Paracoccus sp. (in: a-proteobacteria)]|uniref:MaoC family dehydratase n=1 Tax=Paracoccus sp. TaxID=267 RepID=UPI003A85F183